jgi:phosphoribosyl 1,2-cyclic phosphodiesterase
VKYHLRRMDLLLLEANHDLDMLKVGPYPWSVKQRVMSRVGHLSNDSLAEFFDKNYDGGASYIVLAHLSEQNNHPEIALRAAENALGLRRTLLRNRVMLAQQDAPMDTIRL